MTLANRFDYKGRRIQTNGNPDMPEVKVFRNSCFLNPLFVTTSLDLAMQWVDRQLRDAPDA